MQILNRLIDGLCNLQHAAENDDFVGRWAKLSPWRMQAAANVAQRLKDGKDPHSMGLPTIPTSEWNEIKSKYEDGIREIQAFWTLYVANVIDQIDRITGKSLSEFRAMILSQATFPPGVALSTTHPIASEQADGPRVAEWYSPRAQDYLGHLRDHVLPKIDATGKLTKLLPAEINNQRREHYLAAARSLSAATACRYAGMLEAKTKKEPLQVFIHKLLNNPIAEKLLAKNYARGQTLFPTNKDYPVHVDLVTHPYCAKLAQQRTNSVTVKDSWASCSVQPGRYGDQNNGSAQYMVLTPALSVNFHMAVFCTVAESILESTVAANQPVREPARGKPNTKQVDIMPNSTPDNLEELLANLPQSMRVEVKVLIEKQNSWLKIMGPDRQKRFASMTDAIADQILNDRATVGIDLLDLPHRWAATRDAYAGTLQIDWAKLDPSGRAVYIDLTLVGQIAGHYRVIPHELEQITDDEVQILIEARDLDGLKPANIVDAFERSVWAATAQGEVLRLFALMPMNLAMESH